MNVKRGRDRRRAWSALAGVVVAAIGLTAYAQAPKPDAPTRQPESKPGIVKPENGDQRPAALKGYCPASYLLEGKAVKGDPAFAVPYAGETYYLANAKTKAQFEADPEGLSPQFTGLCTTALGGSYENRFPGDPEVFDIQHGKVYLFSSERAKRAYVLRRRWFITRSEKLFIKPALDGYCPVTILQRGKVLRGGGRVSQLYRGLYYHFLNQHLRAEFILDPEKYLPQYNGYCTEGVSRGKEFVALPKNFVLRNGKVYLFYDSEVQMEFLANAEAMIKKADTFWAAMKSD